ncbi:MAG: methyltransferase domain-containing protein [Gammaproteobacteria bacterium]|nr:methyltransferase domain-containing protein [Gammaproteobacteria bacterium]
MNFETAHAAVLEWLPKAPGLVLDVGAGSGRDARWFAACGHEVFAVEPAAGLRDLAEGAGRNPRIHWIDDRLPELTHIGRATTAWDLIWLSAVWMHLPPADRSRAFRKLSNRLRPGGRLIITLRHGSFEDGRVAHPVSIEELLRLASEHGLICRFTGRADDVQRRPSVSWEAVVLELPDDGSGAFPILRSIVLNDAKSSTYKLGLLRCLIQIAAGAAGVATSDGNGKVHLPLGLVALYWIRTYLPLLRALIPQLPDDRAKPAFATQAFSELTMSPYSLKPGARVTGVQARHLAVALRETSHVIRTMPARYITWPGTQSPIFEIEPHRVRTSGELTLASPYLSTFGTFVVPELLWQAMTRHAVWIEPALTAEWIGLMRRYEGEHARSWETYQGLLRWIDPQHDTAGVRRVVDSLRERDRRITCVWTASRLRGDYAVDHLMPFSRWPCNDLWNLAPVTQSANSRKGDRLPSLALMMTAEERLCGWWENLRGHSEQHAMRFDEEVRCALPFVVNPADVTEVFEGLATLRASLRRDQQIPEWG